MSEVCKVCGICGGTHACNPTDINMNYMSKTIESQTATIKALLAKLAEREQATSQAVKDALEQAASLSDELNPPEYYTQVERDAYSLGIVHYWQAIRALIQK